LWRAFDAKAANGRYRLDILDFALGQAPYRSPSVFNFYSPNYSPPGEMRTAGLVAPELEIADESTVALTANVLAVYSFIATSAATNLQPDDIVIDISGELPLANDPTALVNQVANKLQGGALSSELRAETLAAVERIPANAAAVRVSEAIHAIVTSPEYATLR
jgi:hypothetical protein